MPGAADCLHRYFISIVIEAVKSLLRYNKLIGKLTSLCD